MLLTSCNYYQVSSQYPQDMFKNVPHLKTKCDNKNVSADAKSAVVLRVPSLAKVEVRNFPLLHLPIWLCLIHERIAISLRLVIWKCQCFCLFNIVISLSLS